MALSTAKTYLYYDSTGTPTWTKLVDILNYPDMGSEPNKIDVTSLSESVQKVNILGLQEAPDITFEANYDSATFDTIKALEGTSQDFQLWFDDAGAEGIFEWTGRLTIYAMGGAVDESRKMMISISVETEISKS